MLSRVRFPAFLAAAVGTDKADAALIGTQGSIFPGFIGSLRADRRIIIGRRVFHCHLLIRSYAVHAIIIRMGLNRRRRHLAVIGRAALPATAVGTDNADAVTITAQNAFIPFTVRLGIRLLSQANWFDGDKLPHGYKVLPQGFILRLARAPVAGSRANHRIGGSYHKRHWFSNRQTLTDP